MAQRSGDLRGVRAAAVFTLLLTLRLPLAAQEKPDEEDEFRHPARQNPILREYFREQYLDMKQFGPYGSSRRQRRELPSDTFMDRFIDKRIDHRHHVIDALVTAMTSRGLYQKMAKHWKAEREAGRKPNLSVSPPMRNVQLAC